MKSLLFIAFTLFTTIVFGQKTIRKPVKTIPQLSIYNINGDTTSLQTISKEKVTFIDFWFIPCGPCFAEMNMLHKLYSKYKDNPNVSFLTITITDSSFVRPLLENQNTPTNDTYEYFKTLAQLDTFRLPVYFIKGIERKMTSFKKAKVGFSGHGAPTAKEIDSSMFPDNIFGFSGYPTIFIFDKKGNSIYNKTAFTKDGEKQQQKAIETLIDKNL